MRACLAATVLLLWACSAPEGPDGAEPVGLPADGGPPAPPAQSGGLPAGGGGGDGGGGDGAVAGGGGRPQQDQKSERREDRDRRESHSGGRRHPATVVRVVDGDTIEVRFGGRIVDVRLIGIDTPETVHPTIGVECYGKAASRFTEARLEGRHVRLEFDVERKDRYGRTLAYVWRGGLFNKRLVAGGFATVDTYPPNTRYVERFRAAQASARRHDRGLWGACRGGGGSSGGGGGGNSGGGGGGGDSGGGCHNSYPKICIPPPPPDLDCDDVRKNNFKVRGSDPHGFDGDRDGRGCET